MIKTKQNKRSIFEDVSSEKPIVQASKGGYINTSNDLWRKPASIWLMILFVLVVCVIVVGGLTRLTDSGLSITEWKPITGTIPPLNEIAWAAEFAKYKETPEFNIINNSMELIDFKSIFWWEWGHRQLGRLIGVIWAIGALIFLLKKTVPKRWKFRIFQIGVLIGLQGAIGWWMVSSGLVGTMVDVASYRLAIHLGLAFIILSILVWFIFQLRCKEMELFQAQRHGNKGLMRWGNILFIAVFLQILLGALVAGIDAGRGYIDWPMMNGEFLPSESFDFNPKWKNLFENPALVQFNHRIAGYIVFVLMVWAWIKSRASALISIRRAFNMLAIVILLQIGLGIMTVLYAAPWQVAILHQLGAVGVICFILNACFKARYPKVQSLS